MTAEERKLNAIKLQQAVPLKAIVPGSHKCFLPRALQKAAAP